MIPVCEPTIGEKELEYVTDCLKTNWISSQGKYIEKFEQAFAKFCGVKYGIACANGAAALHLAAQALGIGNGDEVIIPTFTMIACANAVIYAGARPVLVDAEEITGNIDVKQIEAKITPRTRAIMAVHLYGHPCEMDEIRRIAKKHNLKIIEDAAEAHGAEYMGKRAGSLGDIGCFSFYANKIITTGEGGMCVTDDEKLAEQLRLLRNYAFTEKRFMHEQLAFNYRLTNVQAAIGLAQMEHAEELVEARIRNARLYNEFLRDVKGIVTPYTAPYVKNVHWMYAIRVSPDFGVSRDELMKLLLEKGVDTRAFFTPMNEQPLFINGGDERFPDVAGNYPVAGKLGRTGLYLPSGSSLTAQQVRAVVNAIKEVKSEAG